MSGMGKTLVCCFQQCVLVMDFRRQWVREEDLAKDLKLHSKQLRRTLRFFEEEKLVTRDHRKEVSLSLLHIYSLEFFTQFGMLACNLRLAAIYFGRHNISI